MTFVLVEFFALLKAFIKVLKCFLLSHSSYIYIVCSMPGRVVNARNKMKNKIDTDPTHMVHRE